MNTDTRLPRTACSTPAERLPATPRHGGATAAVASLLLALALSARAAAADPSPQPLSPHFIATTADLKARIPAQLRITKPDYVVYVPQADAGLSDTGNEHFLVFDGPDRSRMAVWTQSSVENFSADTPPDQHIAFARSGDGGVTWSRPRILAGPREAGDGHMASWGYPLVSRKGRIYVLYSQSIGVHDTFLHHTGWLHGIASDDNGATWSKPQTVPVARSIHDNPDGDMPPNMLCWQKPLRLGKEGRYLAGFTRWTSFAVRAPVANNLGSADSRVEFMRFENVDDNPEPRDLKISWFMSDDRALAVPFPKAPQNSVCQEPSIVKLPDARLFCVMRTGIGSPCWSVSADGGETWTRPRRLLRRDRGEPLYHPISPCPIYDVGGNEAGSGRYALFLHGHDNTTYTGYRPKPPVTGSNRRPILLAPGRFQPGADQPVWFDEPRFFMDHDNTSLGKPGTVGRMDLSLYSSFTVHGGEAVLWYPDRKFFLLGRIIGGEWFEPAPPGRSPGRDITVAPLERLREQMKTSIYATRPDHVVFVPSVASKEVADASNQHFITFDSPDGALLGVWTQCTREREPDHHIAFARSNDDGGKWSKPRVIAGPRRAGEGEMASWAFPLVSKQGRIYVLYSQSIGKSDTFVHHTGWLDAIASDDCGKTWSAPARIDMPRTRRDNPDASYPPNCIVYQKPQRLARDGRHLVGFSRWTSKAALPNPKLSGNAHDSVVEFMRFENIDANPDPAALKISWLAYDKDALTVPCPGHPETSVAQEPSLVRLPDGRLFCVMRTNTGHPYWSVSADAGETWSRPDVLRRSDTGEALRHPLAPCPIYDAGGEGAGSGRYYLFIHNHNRPFRTFGAAAAFHERRPVTLVRGRFRAGARQPVWFDEPEWFMDHDGIPLGAPGLRGSSLALYGSVTYRGGQMVLWYPDRKFCLLGKRLPPFDEP